MKRVIAIAALATLLVAGCKEGTGEPASTGTASATARPSATATAVSPAALTGPGYVWADGTSMVAAVANTANATLLSEAKGLDITATYGLSADGHGKTVVGITPRGVAVVRDTPKGADFFGDIVLWSTLSAGAPWPSTEGLAPEDGPRQQFGFEMADAATVWVESPSTEADPLPWRLVDFDAAGTVHLLASSEDVTALTGVEDPAPAQVAISASRAYWVVSDPEQQQPSTLLSVSLSGHDLRVEGTGVRSVAVAQGQVYGVTDDGTAVVHMVHGQIEPVFTVGNPASGSQGDQQLGAIRGAGDWLVVEGPTTSDEQGLLAVNLRTLQAHLVVERSRLVDVRWAMCSDAVVWVSGGVQGDRVNRLDLGSGAVQAVEADGAFAVKGCAGTQVVWSAFDEGRTQTAVSTWAKG